MAQTKRLVSKWSCLNVPFVGSEKLKVGHKTKFKDPWKKIVRMSFYVMCNCCRAKGSTISKEIHYDDQAEEISKAKDLAIEKWNMRDEICD